MDITTTHRHGPRKRIGLVAATITLVGGVATVGVVGATQAAAEPQDAPSVEARPGPTATTNPDGSVTLTVPADTVERLCSEVLPERDERIEQLRERVTGDAGTVGSVAWLAERADEAEAAGRPAVAERLGERAERREGRLDGLDRRDEHVAGLESLLCAP